MKILGIDLGPKRKYPIKYDEEGCSARKRAFALFKSGLRPAQVKKQIGISLRTACRYFADWKKLPENFDKHYEIARIFKNITEFNDETISVLAQYYQVPPEEVVKRMQRPWSIHQLLLGKWPDPIKYQVKHKANERLKAALEIIHFLEACTLPPKEINTFMVKVFDEASKIKG